MIGVLFDKGEYGSERAMGFEPMAFSLARRRSTTELRPQTALEGYLDRERMSRFYAAEYVVIHESCHQGFDPKCVMGGFRLKMSL
jgi:hypothetical protein